MESPDREPEEDDADKKKLPAIRNRNYFSQLDLPMSGRDRIKNTKHMFEKRTKSIDSDQNSSIG
jgi:hypothetical protein